LGEHQLDKLGVTGSSPVPPIALQAGLRPLAEAASGVVATRWQQPGAPEASGLVAASLTRSTMAGLTNREIMRVVNRYIGVHAGYLGDFSYRSLE
jgi:hypothetical protein